MSVILNLALQITCAFVVICFADPLNAQQTPRVEIETKTVRGQVVDSKGDPVAEAFLVAPINRLVTDVNPDVARTVTDENGRFTLEFPNEWLRSMRSSRLMTLWAYRPGHALGTINLYQLLNNDSSADPITFVLPDEALVEYTLKDETGNKVVDALVEIGHYRSVLGYEPPPKEITQYLSQRTNSEGKVTLKAMEKGQLYRVKTTTKFHGQQEIQVRDIPDGGELILRNAAPLAGKLISDNSDWLPGIWLYITTEPPVFDNVRQVVGTAFVQTDEKGEFEIPAIAVDNVRVEDGVRDDRPFRLEYPSEVIQVPQEGKFEIRLVSGVVVQGQIVQKENQQPVVGAEIAIQYGEYRQGQIVKSDEHGKFQARVLPGKISQQVIVIPDPELVQVGAPWNEKFTVPQTDEVIELPKIELHGTYEVTGKLTHKKGDPLPGYMVYALKENRRYGFSRCDQDGKFTMRLPTMINIHDIESYGFSSPKTPEIGTCEVINNNPLLLLAR